MCGGTWLPHRTAKTPRTNDEISLGAADDLIVALPCCDCRQACMARLNTASGSGDSIRSMSSARRNAWRNLTTCTAIPPSDAWLTHPISGRGRVLGSFICTIRRCSEWTGFLRGFICGLLVPQAADLNRKVCATRAQVRSRTGEPSAEQHDHQGVWVGTASTPSIEIGTSWKR